MAIRLLLPILCLLTACDNPVDIGGEEHLTAMEVILQDTRGVELARSNVIDDAWISGPLVLVAGAETHLRVVWLDFQGGEFTLEGRAPEFSLRMTVEDEETLHAEPRDGHARLHGLTEGSTRIRFTIYHVDHPDFQSPWLDVDVTTANPQP